MYFVRVQFLGSYNFKASLRVLVWAIPVRLTSSPYCCSAPNPPDCVPCNDCEVIRIVRLQLNLLSIQRANPVGLNWLGLQAENPTVRLAKAHIALGNAELLVQHHAGLICKQWGSHFCEKHLLSSNNGNRLIAVFVALAVEVLSDCLCLSSWSAASMWRRRRDLMIQIVIQNIVTKLPNFTRPELKGRHDQIWLCVADIVISCSMICGGSGGEMLPSVNSLLLGFWFGDVELQDFYGHPSHPMLSVKVESCVLEHLVFFANFPGNATEIRRCARYWYDIYMSNSLTKKRIAFVTDPTQSAQSATFTLS